MRENMPKGFPVAVILSVLLSFHGAMGGSLTIDENWAANADAAAWNSNWTLAPQTVGTFLTPSLGGASAGHFSSSTGAGQSFSRSFGGSSLFQSKTDSYYIQFAVKIIQGDEGSRGAFIFSDGNAYNSGAATTGFSTSKNGQGNFDFYAMDFTGGNQTTTFLKTDQGQNLAFKWNTSYVFDIKVNPVAGLNQLGYNKNAVPTYTVRITELDGEGHIVTSATSALLVGDMNVYNNSQNKNLFFFNSTQNNRDTTLDRITVSNTPIEILSAPEPGVFGLVSFSSVLILCRRHRRR